MKKIINTKILIILILSLTHCSLKKDNLTAYDIEIFEGKTWDLAKAVKNQDTLKINDIIEEGNISVDFQEPRFGETLLMWATKVGKINSVNTLLKNGADPNLQNTYDGTSALMYACDFGPDYSCNSTILKLMLEYGGDPNDKQGGKRPEGSYSRKTPLIFASRCCFEKVKLLVEAGADIDYRSEFGQNALYSALNGAHEKAHIVHYLIVEKNADFCKPVYITSDGREFSVMDELNEWKYSENSKEYKLQKETINYINKNNEKCAEENSTIY